MYCYICVLVMVCNVCMLSFVIYGECVRAYCKVVRLYYVIILKKEKKNGMYNYNIYVVQMLWYDCKLYTCQHQPSLEDFSSYFDDHSYI